MIRFFSIKPQVWYESKTDNLFVVEDSEVLVISLLMNALDGFDNYVYVGEL